MATTGQLNDNRSQFFITFDRCDSLYRKHTLFGKVVGDTIYNLMNMEKLQTDKNDRPIYPPKILSARVVDNPFKDVYPRELKEVRPDLVVKNKNETSPKKKIKKKRKNIGFSFQLSDEEDESDQSNEGDEGRKEMDSKNKGGLKNLKKKSKILGPHDLLKGDRTLDFKEPEIKENDEKDDKRDKDKKKDDNENEDLGKRSHPEDDDEKLNQILDQKGLKVRKNQKTGKVEVLGQKDSDSDSDSSSDDTNSSSDESTDSEQYLTEEQKQMREQKKKEYDSMNMDSLKFKANQEGTNNPQKKEMLRENQKLLSRVELKRYRYLKKKKEEGDDGTDILERLSGFKKRLKEKKENNKGFSWTKHKLKFHIDSSNAYALQQKKKDLGILH